jgi:hypothetical protein
MDDSRIFLSLARDTDVSNTVTTAGEQLLQLYDAVVKTAAKPDLSDKKRLAVHLAVTHYGIKLQSVTRAALTLILTGQDREAMSLIREQNDFVAALNYYRNHPEEAVLFMTSQALLKRNFARQVMTFDDKVAADPKRVAQLAALEKDAQDAYREFPRLRKVKGKSGRSAVPVYADWSEPSAKEMFRDLMATELRKHYTSEGVPFTEDAFNTRLEKMVEKAYFLRNTFISQSKHGTAFALGETMDIDDNGALIFQGPEMEVPDELAYHFIMNAMPPLKIFRDVVAPGILEDRFDKLSEAYVALRKELQIQDTPIPPLHA